MSLIKSMNDIINKNKLVFAFILGLLTCYLIFNCGSCKEGWDDVKKVCVGDNGPCFYVNEVGFPSASPDHWGDD